MTKGLEVLDEVLNHNYFTFFGEILENYEEEINIIKKELKAYSSLKETIKNKIEKLNNIIDEMDKKVEENQYVFADEDFSNEYSYYDGKLSAFEFIMEKLENDRRI